MLPHRSALNPLAEQQARARDAKEYRRSWAGLQMGRVLGSVDRRTFLCATGSAAALSLSGRLGLAQTLPEVGALHRLVEETPHERVAAELAGLIRAGLDHRRTLTALAVATSRRVQPFPYVGFKYHTVLALQSVHLTALNLPDKERWPLRQRHGTKRWRYLPPRPEPFLAPSPVLDPRLQAPRSARPWRLRAVPAAPPCRL